jgi:Mor family transcriptional regulator
VDKAKYIDYKRLKDVMDTTIRDAEIKALFEGLKFSELSYKERISIIKGKYFLGQKAIESVIKKGPKRNP